MSAPLERLLDYIDNLDDVVPEASKFILDEVRKERTHCDDIYKVN
jgi:hypothetical protein